MPNIDKINYKGTEYDLTPADYDSKANVDGYYETFTSGQTEQIIATEAVTDTEPYIYRKTGGPNDVGDRVYDTLVGGSVVWNQLIKSTLSPSAAGGVVSFADGVASFTASTKSGNVYWVARRDAGHKYLAICDIKGTTAVTDGTVCFYDYGRGKPIDVTTSWSRAACLLNPIQTTYSSYWYGVCDYRESGWDTIEVKNYMLIDLTAAVTPTIADYIYSLEQTTAGAGVAWFKKYFPGVYHGFAEPHFEHVQVSAKNTVGFNQWDEEWEVGGYVNGTGEPWTTSDRIRSKSTNYIPVLGGQTYFSKCSVAINYYFYDENKAFLSHTVINSESTFVVPSNARYMRFFVNTTYGTTYNHDICINLHGDRDGEYEPYKKRTYPLDSSLILRGIPKLDSANRLYYDGDIYRHDGTVKRRMYTVNSTEFTLGTYDASTSRWTIILPSSAPEYKYVLSSDVLNMIPTNGFPVVSKNNLTALSYGLSASDASVLKYVILKLDATQITTLTQATEWLQNNPFELTYEVNEPTIEAAEPFQSPMVVDPLGTEAFVDYGVEEGDRDVAIPVGHESEYPSDLRGKLQHLPSLASADGRYCVQQSGKQMSLVADTSPGRLNALENKIPDPPMAEGNYQLTCSVNSVGSPSFSWVAVASE